MTKLSISLRGDEYSRDQKVEMWAEILIDKKCPECSEENSMLKGPSVDDAMNIKCSGCNMIFWITPFRSLGAYPVGMDIE